MNPPLVHAAIVTAAMSLLLAGCGQGGPGVSRAPHDAGSGRVVRVTDGDTMVVRHGGVDDRVRLVGIDTPEVRGPYTQEECFGSQASRRMRELVARGSGVRLETDPTQDARDRNGRLLAYVYRSGEATSLNERMVAEGFARHYVVGRPFTFATRFKRLEAEARRQHRGMWAGCPSPEAPQTAPAPDASRACPADAPIKGNLPSRIYHRPRDASYDATRPERCFATPTDAERAGFRPPR